MLYIPVVLVIAVSSAVIALTSLLAAVVPQWFYVHDFITFGLRDSCTGSSCQSISWDTTGICASPGEWKNRQIAVEALLWTTLGLALISALVVGLALLRKHALEGDWKMLGLVAFSCFTAALAFIAVVVYAATMDSWINCGSSFCASFPGATSCTFGASFIVYCLVIVAHAFAALLLVARWRGWLLRWTVLIDRLLFVVLVIAAVLTIAAGASTSWWTVSYGSPGNYGMLEVCSGSTCHSLSAAWPGQIVYGSSCSVSGGALIARSNTVAALLLIGFVIMFTVATLHFLRQFQMLIRSPFSPTIRLVMVALVALACIMSYIAMFVFAGTYDSWLFCGTSFCSAMGSAYCTYGFSFACCIVALIVFVFLLTVMIADVTGCASSMVSFTEPAASSSSSTHVQSSSTPYGTTRGETTVKETVVTNTVVTVVTEPRPQAAASSSRVIPYVDDWELDEDSGYYYSPSRRLYKDSESSLVYDPNQPDKGWFRE